MGLWPLRIGCFGPPFLSIFPHTLREATLEVVTFRPRLLAVPYVLPRRLRLARR